MSSFLITIQKISLYDGQNVAMIKLHLKLLLQINNKDALFFIIFLFHSQILTTMDKRRIHLVDIFKTKKPF